MKKIDIVKGRLKKYEDRNAVHNAMIKRQIKLNNLISKHGVDLVSLAGGYNVSTLKQYIRMSNPIIGKENLDKAVFILKDL